MQASRWLTGRHGRHKPEGDVQERHRRCEPGIVQKVVRTEGVTRCVLVTDRIIMAVVMRMPVVGLRGDGVLDVVKISYRAEDRLQQHAQRHDQKQGMVEETAVVADSLHGCVRAYRLRV